MLAVLEQQGRASQAGELPDIPAKDALVMEQFVHRLLGGWLDAPVGLEDSPNGGFKEAADQTKPAALGTWQSTLLLQYKLGRVN